MGGVEVAGLTREQAKVKLANRIADHQVVLTFNGSMWQIPKELLRYDIEASMDEGYRYGRRLEVADYLLLLINKQTNYPLKLMEGESSAWDEWSRELAPIIEIPPSEPVVALVKKTIVVTNGSDGVIIDRDRLKHEVLNVAEELGADRVEIPTMVVNKQLSEEEMQRLRQRGEGLLDKSLILEIEDERIPLMTKEMVALLYTGQDATIFDPISVHEYVKGVAESMDRPPQDAKFEFADGKVQEFAPGRDGIAVSKEMTEVRIQEGLEKLMGGENRSEAVQIAVTRTPPIVTTDKVNELGIRERIGRGESYYAHSIPNRIYNVGLAARRINSVLIPPGEDFSFNHYVGEISGATGYRPAYVIAAGRTVLGDGGGVCQVSTTIFRAAMNSGLPITERWGHAYRVSYYELNSKPGVDATVYAPSKDIKFKNDTPGHILIQMTNDPKKLHLVVEIYGTNDGRVATITEPKVWGISPPPPDIYQDDPSLPVGTTKQVDWSAWGAKASFEYKVVRGEETLQEKTFTTAYRPWANVYLRGTGI